MTHILIHRFSPRRHAASEVRSRDVNIPPLGLQGTLRLPSNPRGLVLFAHGSGSSRLSPRNMRVAESLNEKGFGTVLFDLLTVKEEELRENVFDIALLAQRLGGAVLWARQNPETATLPIGLFGASTGAGAALVAAAALDDTVSSVVSRGGRPDLAGAALSAVRAPTLLIVGGADHGVIQLNEQALNRLTCEKALIVVPGATHLFPEPGTLERVIDAAARWFLRTLASEHPGGSPIPPDR